MEAMNSTDEACAFLKRAVNQSSQAFIANVVTCIVDSLVFVSAPVINAFIVYAIWTTNALHSPPNTLLCCLAITDCLTGLIVAPMSLVNKVGEIFRVFKVYCVGGIISSLMVYTTASVSFLTLALIAVERYLALYLHLRYMSIVTSGRMIKTVVFFWFYMASLSALRFVDTNESILRPVVMFNLVAFLTVTLFCYFKIYSNVQRHRAKIRAESHSVQHCEESIEVNGCKNSRISRQNSAELARYRRSTLTMVYIVGCFLLCYSPTLAYQLVLLVWTKLDDTKTRIAYKYCFSVVLLKSSLDPLLYCWRITDIRRVFRRILAQMLTTK